MVSSFLTGAMGLALLLLAGCSTAYQGMRDTQTRTLASEGDWGCKNYVSPSHLHCFRIAFQSLDRWAASSLSPIGKITTGRRLPP